MAQCRITMAASVVLIFLAALSARATSLTVIPGDTLQWLLTNDSTSVPGRVPGGVYTDLLTGGVLDQGDFYYRYNDLDYRWVSYANWTYSTTFEVSPELRAEARVILEFEGVDTVATIVANGQVVGSTDNMFVKYLFDITQVVESSSEVTIEVQLESPTEWSRKAFESQSESYVVPPICLDPQYKGECHANHIRKMQSSFAWDWGPAFPNAGIWKPMKVVGFSTVYVSDMIISYTPVAPLPRTPAKDFRTSWDMEVQVDFRLADKSVPMLGEVTFYIDGSWVSIQGIIIGPSASDLYTHTFSIPAGHDYDLWWPAGYGVQALYEFEVEWRSEEIDELTSKSTKIGFRTTELDQGLVDFENPDFGRYYRVFINNVLVFMRGSNWIPAHVLTEMVTPEYTRRLLQDAVLANQNAIRIWGGGIYESDAFYEIADELGIVVWQDLMFACSMYPSSEWFLNTVDQEIKNQVRRLNTHPSVLLYITNNENEGALRDNWYGTGSDFDTYKADYITLYVDTIRPIIEASDISRPVVISSPSNGIQSELDGFISEWPGNPLFGDVHYYNYLSNAWSPETYPKPRFASEYGFQSWPSFRSMANVSDPDDWVVGSSLLEHRQHHPNGQAELDIQIGLHMNLPDPNGGEQAFKHYLYLTQVHQAMAIRTESELYRRLSTSIDAEGYGHTAGALYWQLNDIWQGASWASIEYGGRWKMLHYFVKKFFNPTLVSPYLQDSTVLVSFVNDLLLGYADVNLTVNVHSYLSLEPVNTITLEALTFNPQLADVVAVLDLNTDLQLDTVCQDDTYSPTDLCFLTFSATTPDGAQVAPETFLLLGEPKNSPLQPATVVVSVVSGPILDGSTYTITLTTDQVALFVFLETDVDGVFSDNGFVMTQPTVELLFMAREVTESFDLLLSLEVTTLVDTYAQLGGDTCY